MSASRAAAIVAVSLSLVGCGPHEPRADSVLALRGDAARGGAVYQSTCAHCHHGGWSLTLPFYGPGGVVSTLIDGVPKTRMPSFAAWSDQQLADVLAYLRTQR